MIDIYNQTKQVRNLWDIYDNEIQRFMYRDCVEVGKNVVVTVIDDATLARHGLTFKINNPIKTTTNHMHTAILETV